MSAPSDVRPDLSGPRGLSKTELGTFDICNHKSWFQLHFPQPWEPNERMSFGSALDAGVEVMVRSLASAKSPDIDDATDHAQVVIDRDGQPVDIDEVHHALARFPVDVAPRFNWTHAVTQPTLRAEIRGLGASEGHPDIGLPDGILDVKGTTGKRAKEPDSLELGFYVLLSEAAGIPVDWVGYLEWRRGAPNGSLVTGVWRTPTMRVTDEFRRWTHERASAYVRAKRADRILNEGMDEPMNFSFPNGPLYPWFCTDCPFNPAVGGPCAIARREEAAA